MLEGQPDWIPARLFTTAGLRGAHEQEVRASAALMSILGAVPAFSRPLLKPLGAPGGGIETFTEVILKTRSGDTLRPDGVVLVTRGQRSWGCLVEVKTGRAELTKFRASGFSPIWTSTRGGTTLSGRAGRCSGSLLARASGAQ